MCIIFPFSIIQKSKNYVALCWRDPKQMKSHTPKFHKETKCKLLANVQEGWYLTPAHSTLSCSSHAPHHCFPDTWQHFLFAPQGPPQSLITWVTPDMFAGANYRNPDSTGSHNEEDT